MNARDCQALGLAGRCPLARRPASPTGHGRLATRRTIPNRSRRFYRMKSAAADARSVADGLPEAGRAEPSDGPPPLADECVRATARPPLRSRRCRRALLGRSRSRIGCGIRRACGAARGPCRETTNVAPFVPAQRVGGVPNPENGGLRIAGALAPAVQRRSENGSNAEEFPRAAELARRGPHLIRDRGPLQRGLAQQCRRGCAVRRCARRGGRRGGWLRSGCRDRPPPCRRCRTPCRDPPTCG